MAGKSTRNSPGEGSIYKEGNRYRAALTVGPNGKRKTFSGKSKREVKEKLEEYRRMLEGGIIAADAVTPLGEYLTQWIDGRQVREITRQTYKNRCHHVAQVIGPVSLNKLNPGHINLCYRTLQAEGLSHRTIHSIHVTLSGALRAAVRSRILNWNPCEVAEVPKVEGKEMQTLTLTQAQDFLESTAEHRFHVLWAVLLTTGLRIGEALSLHWSEVDLAAGELKVRYTLHTTRGGGGYDFDPPKSPSSRRTVQVPAETCDLLREHRKKQQAGIVSIDNLVFPEMDGTPLDSGTVRYHLLMELRRLKLPRLSTHGLRHSYATIALHDWEIPVKVVSKNLGHASIRITLDIYGHALPDHEKKAAEKMGGLLRRTGV